MLLMAAVAQAQMMEPVKFSSSLKMLNNNEAEIVFSATIDDGWHVYSTDLGSEGPIEASLHVNKLEGAQLVGKLKPRGKEVEQFDQMFGMKLRFFEKHATFVQRIRFNQPQYNVDVFLEYGACNDQMCMPPTEVPFKKKGTAPNTAPSNNSEPSDNSDYSDYSESSDSLKSSTTAPSNPPPSTLPPSKNCRLLAVPTI